MKPFDRITNYIFKKIQNTGLSRFTLEDIRFMIEDRNNNLDLFELEWIDFDSDDKEELEFKKDMYFNLQQSYAESDIEITDDELDIIFGYELEIVGNKKVNYYDNYLISLEDGRHIQFSEIDFKKEYAFDKWTDWEDCVDKACEEFYEEFDLYPNVLTANKHTHSQISFLINNIPGLKDNVFFIEKQSNLRVPVDNNEEVVVGRYECEDYILEFYFDERIKNKVFFLEYRDDLEDNDDDDEDDGGDDDDVNVPVPVNVGELTRV